MRSSAGRYRAALAVFGTALAFVGFDMTEKGKEGGPVWLVFGFVLVASALPLIKKEG